MKNKLLAAGLGALALGFQSCEASNHSMSAGNLDMTERVVTIVSDGSDVDLAQHLEEGAWTLFEYTAEW